MNKSELAGYHTRPINYRIAEKIGAGTLNVMPDSVSIIASNPQEGIVGVEPIKLTTDQCEKITIVDEMLYLED